jgi:mRNA interferase MazF
MGMIKVKRGEIYWVDWGEGKGSEQSGRRPALIIQNDTGNEVSPNTIIASLTTAPKKLYPFLVHFTARESGLDKSGVVDLASIMTISKTRLGEKCGQLNAPKMNEVDIALKVSLGLGE